jgi:hypothetical protein
MFTSLVAVLLASAASQGTAPKVARPKPAHPHKLCVRPHSDNPPRA